MENELDYSSCIPMPMTLFSKPSENHLIILLPQSDELSGPIAHWRAKPQQRYHS